jgi:hypothetical protein
MASKPQLIYHKLDEPFFPNPYGENSGISALNDLYPGRPLTTSDGFNRYEIPAEDPEGAKRTFQNSKRETQEYASYLVDRSVADGGGDKKKVLTHAIDDPSSVIDDPDLASVSMQTPQTENEGRPLKEAPTITPELINSIIRGLQPAGNARSEGLARSPVVAGTTGNLIEPFEATEKEKSGGYDSILSHLFLAATLILLIIALATVLKK